MLRAMAVLAIVIAGPGCSSGPAVSVDLRTDLAPGREFVRVETTLAENVAVDGGEVSQRFVAHNVSATGDYLLGVRVADLANLPRGDYVLRVDLRDMHDVVATRRVDIAVTGHVAITVVMTRNCVGVTCPPSSDPSLTECVDDRCVDPHCSPSTPELCPTTTGCTADSDCHADGCGRASCASGTCLVAPDDAHCGLGQICFGGDLTCIPAPMDGDAGTTPFPPRGDAAVDDIPDGMDDAGPGTGAEICTNGVDDDGDGQIDCADSNCASANCDDHDRCTYRDLCRSGTCAGTHRTCGSTSICPGNACNGTRRCRAAPAPAGTACGDGVNPQPCNGDYCDGAGHCQLSQRRPDGASCGTAQFHCCAGLCVDLTGDEANCGACGVRCDGATCQALPSTHFGTCGCTTDIQCRAYGVGAWCSPGGRCQCNCGCNRDALGCSMHCDAACGLSTATCADVGGQDNYCAYTP